MTEEGAAAKRVKVDEESPDNNPATTTAAAAVEALAPSEDGTSIPIADAAGAESTPQTKLDDEEQRLLDSLEEEEFAVVLGGVSLAKPGAGTTLSISGEASGAAPARDGTGPALRFSMASSSAPTLALRTTAEQEEALRVMGVTGSNYAQKMNPQGFIPGRRPNAFEIDIETLDHPKWREPGSIQSDFFNYGLLENTWREYAARQVALRLFRLQKIAQQQQHQEEGSAGDAGER